MKSYVQIETHNLKPVLAIYMDSIADVNSLTLSMMEAGFLINYEPKYVAQEYEGCFLCGEECDVVIRLKHS